MAWPRASPQEFDDKHPVVLINTAIATDRRRLMLAHEPGPSTLPALPSWSYFRKTEPTVLE